MGRRELGRAAAATCADQPEAVEQEQRQDHADAGIFFLALILALEQRLLVVAQPLGHHRHFDHTEIRHLQFSFS
jgi:hypothetical protein